MVILNRCLNHAVTASEVRRNPKQFKTDDEWATQGAKYSRGKALMSGKTSAASDDRFFVFSFVFFFFLRFPSAININGAVQSGGVQETRCHIR